MPHTRESQKVNALFKKVHLLPTYRNEINITLQSNDPRLQRTDSSVLQVFFNSIRKKVLWLHL